MLFVTILLLTGCAGNQQEYQKAFDSQHSLTQNQFAFTQSSDSIFKIVKQTFVQQGFTIENADLKSGIVKAVRNMQDRENPDISYNIHASADISEVVGTGTNISMSASQQTILHRATTTWWHLLWIFPVIPTGTEYQTLVVKEGNITDPGFYTDFFNAMKIAVTKYDLAVKAAAAKAAEKAEAERVAAEKAAKIKAEEKRIEAEKAATEKADADRIAAEKAAAEKAEADRIAAEKAAAGKAEADRVVAEKAAATKAEVDRIAAEIASAEKLEAEKTAAIEAANVTGKEAVTTKPKPAAQKKKKKKKKSVSTSTDSNSTTSK
jgi:hypothetical protein